MVPAILVVVQGQGVHAKKDHPGCPAGQHHVCAIVAL